MSAYSSLSLSVYPSVGQSETVSCDLSIRQFVGIFILNTVTPLLRDSKHYLTNPDCRSTAKAIATDIPLTDRISGITCINIPGVL